MPSVVAKTKFAGRVVQSASLTCAKHITGSISDIWVTDDGPKHRGVYAIA
jgi:hypothetical protein